MINNVDDALSISLAVTCDQQRPQCRITAAAYCSFKHATTQKHCCGSIARVCRQYLGFLD